MASGTTTVVTGWKAVLRWLRMRMAKSGSSIGLRWVLKPIVSFRWNCPGTRWRLEPDQGSHGCSTQAGGQELDRPCSDCRQQGCWRQAYKDVFTACRRMTCVTHVHSSNFTPAVFDKPDHGHESMIFIRGNHDPDSLDFKYQGQPDQSGITSSVSVCRESVMTVLAAKRSSPASLSTNRSS